MIRTFDHGEVEELARHATIPVINGLTDLSHPCQVLADLFTVREALSTWEGKRIAWVGDGNNMANSWIEAAQVLGFELRLACPEGYEPSRAIFERALAAGAAAPGPPRARSQAGAVRRLRDAGQLSGRDRGRAPRRARARGGVRRLAHGRVRGQRPGPERVRATCNV